MRTLTRVLLMAALAATVAMAQRGGGGGGGRKGGGDMGAAMPMGMGMKNPIDIIAEELKLNKDQKKDVKNILDEAQKEANPVRDQMSKSRIAIGEAVAGGKSQDEINQLSAAEGALEAQMAMIELHAFVKVYNALDSEQKNLTRSFFPTTKGMFSGKNWNSLEAR